MTSFGHGYGYAPPSTGIQAMDGPLSVNFRRGIMMNNQFMNFNPDEQEACHNSFAPYARGAPNSSPLPNFSNMAFPQTESSDTPNEGLNLLARLRYPKSTINQKVLETAQSIRSMEVDYDDKPAENEAAQAERNFKVCHLCSIVCLFSLYKNSRNFTYKLQ